MHITTPGGAPELAGPSVFDGYRQMSDPDSGLKLRRYARIVNKRKWSIVAMIVAVTAGTYFVCRTMTPVYESTATLDVDLQAPRGILGQDAQHVTAISDADQFLATQVSLLEADSVVRPVAAQYDLLKREKQDAAHDPYYSPDAPVRLKQLKIKRTPNTYLITVSYRATDRKVAADVANAITSSYISHTYDIRNQSTVSLSAFMDKQLAELRAKMEKSGTALAKLESELDMVNPEEKTSIVSARLLQLNNQYTDAQADRMQKEAAFQSTKSGTLDAAQVSPQGESLQELLQRENEAKVNLAQKSQLFGPRFPEVRQARAQLEEIQAQIAKAGKSIQARTEIAYTQSVNRERMLEKALADTKSEFDRLNVRSYEYQQAKREAEGDKKLYDDLVRKIKEASINTGMQSNVIRVADAARPSVKPVFPRTNLWVALAFALSAIMAIGSVVLFESFDDTVTEPEEVAKAFGLRVLGTLPRVKPWSKHTPQITAGDGGSEGFDSTPQLRAGENREIPMGIEYRESIRSLRKTILRDHAGRRIRTILITSSLPGEGKSVAAAHLALSYAAQGKRILLVDGDMRRPSLHRIFDAGNQLGLTSVALGQIDWHEALHRVPGTSPLDILPAGPTQRNAGDLAERVIPIFEEAAGEYDLVIVDSPPLLGFAEPLEMAPSVDGVVVITRAGETNRNALGAALFKLAEVRTNILGVILNGFTPRHLDDYQKHYASYLAETAS